MWDPFSEFNTHELPNGLKVWKLHLPGRPWEKVRIIVHTGYSSDPVGKEGLAHFCEHLVKAQYSTNSDELRSRFKSFGGAADFGVTGPNCTYYEFSVPHEFEVEDILSWGYEVYRDLLTRPATLEASEVRDLEKERKIIVSEFHRKFSMAWEYPLHVTFRSTLYPGLWQSRVTNGLGSLDCIAQFTEDDVVNFFRKWYVPSNMTIVSVGGASKEDIFEIASRHFEHLPSFGASRPAGLITTSAPRPLCPETVFNAEGVSRSEIMTFSLLPTSISRSIVSIVTEMLRKSVFEDVRQKRHLAYSSTCSSLWWDNCVQVCMSATGVSSDAEETVKDCFLEAVRRVTIDTNLFEESQQYLIARKSMLDLNGSAILSDAGEDISSLGRVTSLNEEVSGLREVTHHDIRTLVDLWLVPERFYVRVVKP